ncbi:MAG TPA: glucose-6-phosphate dehydrogenase [Longimicrobiales bacterium]
MSDTPSTPVVADLGVSDSPPTPDPCTIVIFGASGDLARRELFPALFDLHRQGLLPDGCRIVGVAREPWKMEDFRTHVMRKVRQSVEHEEAWPGFAKRVRFIRGDADTAEDYTSLAATLRELEADGAGRNVLFHLAVPPALFGTIAMRLGEAGLAHDDDGWRRLIVEKPFGRDRETALALDRQLREVFGESQIYRVDHFLGKETVQNMLVFRFANPAFEPIWNRNFIDHVQITVAESIGIGTRAAFYEQTGVVRDMIQNHLLQLLCMTAMEPPIRFGADALRDETVKVLEAATISPIDVERDAVRGQYDRGTVSGEEVVGYRGEKGVPADSNVSTYAAVKLTLDNWRWAGVPFYMRTGKRMTRGLTEVAIHFKRTPHYMFGTRSRESMHQSVLVFELQPDEGIVQTLAAKQPGPNLTVRTVRMEFRYAEAFGIEEPPSSYAWLLLDAMQGDQTLFARADWVDAAWRIVDPLIAHWSNTRPTDFPNYAAGSAGPAAADELLARDGRKWRPL